MMLRTARVSLLVAVVVLTPYFAAGAAPTPFPAPASSAPAPPPSPPPPPDNPDPWAKLCDPGMKWELEPLEGGKRTKKSGHAWPIIRIENTDQRMVGDIKICRLRWFLVEEGKKPVDFDSKKIDQITQGMLDTPSWESAQWPIDHARWVAVAPDGLKVLMGRGGKVGPTDESVLAQLKRTGPTFPGDRSSAEQRTKYLKAGRHRWSFATAGRRIWCYGYQDTACTAEDSTCHAAACFENGVGLVALYVDSGARKFPDEFKFYSAVAFPEYAAWKRDTKQLDW